MTLQSSIWSLLPFTLGTACKAGSSAEWSSSSASFQVWLGLKVLPRAKLQQFVLGSALIQFLVPAYCSPVGQRVLWFLTCHAWARAPLLGFWKSQYRSRGGFPGRSSPPVGGAAFCTFLQFQGKVLASAAGNIFAKKRRLKTSRFLPPLPKALENNFKEEHPPSMQSAKHPFVGSQTRPMKWGRDIFFDHLLLRQTRG